MKHGFARKANNPFHTRGHIGVSAVHLNNRTKSMRYWERCHSVSQTKCGVIGVRKGDGTKNDLAEGEVMPPIAATDVAKIGLPCGNVSELNKECGKLMLNK